MCGRYYIDDETAREIEKLVRKIDENLKTSNDIGMMLAGRDIRPSDLAPILIANGQGGFNCQQQRWGFPGFKGKQVIFNARSETVLEKKMFRQNMEQRRVVVPATWFYEWNKNKEKHTFYRKGQSIIFMAGIYDLFDGEKRFTILTTAANESMIPVHDRMPIILERDELVEWITNKEWAVNHLNKKPCQLDVKTEFEQISLF